MDHALVVVEPTERGRELIKLAGEIAEGTGAELVLVRIVDEDAYEGDVQRKAESSLSDVSSVNELTDEATAVARELGEELLPEDITYSAEALFGNLPGDLLEHAEERRYDHVFITGERRSPTGKVLFGDTTQAVLLNFDGPVTSLIG